MAACVDFRANPHRGARTHQFEAQIYDAFIRREQMRIDEAHPVCQPLHLAFEVVGRVGFEGEADLRAVGAGQAVPGPQ